MTSTVRRARPRDDDLVVWSIALTDGTFRQGAWRPRARLLFPSQDLAVGAARLLAGRLRADAWSTADGVSFSLVAHHRQLDEQPRTDLGDTGGRHARNDATSGPASRR